MNYDYKRRGYDYESSLQRALKLSQQTFEKEQRLRKEAKKLQQQIIEREKAKWSEEKSYETLLSLMRWQPLFVHRGVGSGLRNLGNSCFMNATLQCLAYTPPFSQLLCQSNHSSQCKKSKDSFCALCEMERVIPSMLMGKDVVSPKNLFKHLGQINDLLTAGCQEDAHEFIQSLLDRVELAYDDQQRPIKRKDPQNPIRKLFTGATKTCIQCARCKRKSVTEEPFCCISLEVDDNVGLDEALEIFTQDELMRGDDKYFCSHCQRKCIAHKRLTLSDVPPIFIMHLKRFAIQFQAAHHKQGTMKKLSYHVEFPEVLDLKQMSHLIFEDDQQRVLEDSEYQLYAVLVHSGPQLGYGHYYALIRSPDGYWFRMNDMEVIPVSLKHVLREQGYILFYRRNTDRLMQTELQRIRQQQEEQKEVAVATDTASDCKVDHQLLTHDYFANHCQQPQDLVVVDAVPDEQAIDCSAPDRQQYVQVPPMATRPELTTKSDDSDRDEMQEVFWPLQSLENL